MNEAVEAQECSLLVTISFHYVEHRLLHILDVVRALADFEVRRLHIEVLTNDIDVETRDRVHQLLACNLPSNMSLMVRRCTGLSQPFALTWIHKRFIPQIFLADGSPYTHFLYLEDDMRFGFGNFRYFLKYRPLLAQHGLLPSFARVEYSAAKIELRATDFIRPFNINKAPVLRVGDYLFAMPSTPYCALYVLDQELAREHIATPAFSPRTSMQTAPRWGLAERAAAGLCFESPPPGYTTRYVLPVNPATRIIAAESWVPHLPNNYADKPGEVVAQFPIVTLVNGPSPETTG